MDKIVLPTRTRATDDFLTPLTVTGSASTPITETSAHVEISSPQEVLTLLKSKPDYDALKSCLDLLASDNHDNGGFHVRKPGPLASQLIHTLVHEIVPSYWRTLTETTSQRKTCRRLIKILRSSAGIAATVQRLKALLNTAPQNQANVQIQQAVSTEPLVVTLESLECVLHGDEVLHSLWNDILHLEQQKTKRILMADGLVNMLASGNVIAVAAQIDGFIQEKSKEIHKGSWLSLGRNFTSWLGRNILHLSVGLSQDDLEGKHFRTAMFSKALRLGHDNDLVSVIFALPLRGLAHDARVYREILNDLPSFVQPSAYNALLHLLAQSFSSTTDSKVFVSGSSALLQALVGTHTNICDHLVKWLTGFNGGNVAFPLEIFRSVILLVSQDLARLRRSFDRSLELFGSKHYIQQNPLLQQEAQTKVLLIVAGYVHRLDPDHLRKVKISSPYLGAISNRLAASTPRLQFFGMVAGMAISGLVDREKSILDFDTDNVKSKEGKALRELVYLRDTIGSITDLQSAQKKTKNDADTRKAEIEPIGKANPVPKASAKVQPTKEPKSKIVAIEEIDDSESEDDLPVYAKPDSDPEDSDDDPTTINRNKPTAPVYIRDLLAGLRADDNYDRHKLAIEHAPALIRRKMNFGTEVLDHIEELATKLIGLKDSFNMDDFQQKRLQAMIAVIIAKPVVMSKWFANTYFNGDYSMSQRAAILSALAFAARELAGFKDEDSDMTGVNDVPDFPSKRLPGKYAKMYQLEAAPLNRLVGKLERDIIKPMALEAADKATGPDVLKVRTFSSRMEVEKKRKRAIPNELAKIVAEGFFYPLTGRWSSVVRARGDGSIFTSPFLLSHFLRTLALILNASGSSTLALPGMTTELWSLLLSLRRYALTDQSVLEALLFANLTLIEINSNDHRRLAEDHGQELMETQAWAQPVFQNLRGGAKEEERVKMLASALLIKVKEVIEQYQHILLGRFAPSR